MASYLSSQLWDGHLGDSYAIMVDLGLLIKWQCAYTGTRVMCCSVKGVQVCNVYGVVICVELFVVCVSECIVPLCACVHVYVCASENVCVNV